MAHVDHHRLAVLGALAFGWMGAIRALLRVALDTIRSRGLGGFPVALVTVRPVMAVPLVIRPRGQGGKQQKRQQKSGDAFHGVTSFFTGTQKVPRNESTELDAHETQKVQPFIMI
jgi:hypothetical protein